MDSNREKLSVSGSVIMLKVALKFSDFVNA